MKLRILLLALGFFISLPISKSTLAASFQALGDLPGGNRHSWAYGVSGDGSTVIGASYSSSGLEAFRWTQATGMVGLGDLPGGQFISVAEAVSFDGSVVMGWSSIDGGDKRFKWAQAEGISPVANGYNQGAALLGNGTIVMASGFAAHAASSNGSAIVGHVISGNTTVAVRWTQLGGVVSLANLPQTTQSSANNVSADGSVVVGHFVADNLYQAFRWTQAEGMVGLGDLPGYNFQSEAFGASANGSVIVGASHGYSLSDEAFIWDASHGMRRLQTVLEELGLDLGGRLLETAYDISDDGQTIVGTAYDPLLGRQEAFIAVIPEPHVNILLGTGGTLLACRLRRPRQ